MPVGSTPQRSVQVSGFDDIGRLTPLQRLVSASCSSGQRFAFGFLQIRSYPRHPCRSANSSPCRVSRGLTPPSKCALPGAPKKKPAVTRASFAFRAARKQSQNSDYSHSIVAGGLPEMSYTTRLMPRTSLMIRLLTLPSRLCGSSAQCAVMKSCVCTARSATTYS